MVEYGKGSPDGAFTGGSSEGTAPKPPIITVPDALISEFLALHGVEAAPPGKPSTTKNAFMGAVVGANPLVGGMLHVVNNQQQGSAQSEWLSWKQWALAHQDWPAFWEPHKERIIQETALNSKNRSTSPPKRQLKYGEAAVSSSQGRTNKVLHQKPVNYFFAIIAGALGGPFGLVVSPLVLWGCSINGEKVIKKKNGQEQKVGVWAQWAAAGTLLAPTLALITLALNPTPEQQNIAQPTPPEAFQPGVPGRSSSEVCNSNSQECQTWTALATACQENMRQREAGYMGRFDRNYCTEMEEYRERVSGVALSTDPGAYNF